MIALLLATAPVAAGPVYLSCVITNDRGPFPVNLTVDEQGQTVTTAMPTTGFAERLPAVFAPTTVTFRNGMTSYELSRVDLKITRTLTIGDKSWPDGGTCKVEAAPKRAF